MFGLDLVQYLFQTHKLNLFCLNQLSKLRFWYVLRTREVGLELTEVWSSRVRIDVGWSLDGRWIAGERDFGAKISSKGTPSAALAH